MKITTNTLLFAMAVATIICNVNVYNAARKIRAVNERLEHLYTERGFNELKCKAAGGGWVEESTSGWAKTFNKEKGEWNEGKSVAYYKQGCFRASINKEEVEIKI